jgi:hypothetical protein
MDEQKLRQEHYYYKRKAKWYEFYEQYIDNQSIAHINEKAKEFADKQLKSYENNKGKKNIIWYSNQLFSK